MFGTKAGRKFVLATLRATGNRDGRVEQRAQPIRDSNTAVKVAVKKAAFTKTYPFSKQSVSCFVKLLFIFSPYCVTFLSS